MKDIRAVRAAVTAAVVSVIMGVFATCGKQAPEQAFLVFSVGDVKVVSAAGGETGAKVKQSLAAGDAMKTGAASFAIIQIGESIMVRVQENTLADIKSLMATGREIHLRQGRVLSAVKLLKQGDAYSVSTPTAIAAVRGTEFTVAYDGATELVAVRKGKVEITRTGADGPLPVNEGAVVTLAEKAVERPINADESGELQRIAEVPAIPGIEKKTGDEIDAIIRPIIEKQSGGGHARSWEELQKKYGRIDTVVLYSGKSVRGAIVERGQTWKIETPAGFEYVKSASVRQTQ